MAALELLPIRCKTCGKVLADKQDALEMLVSGSYYASNESQKTVWNKILSTNEKYARGKADLESGLSTPEATAYEYARDEFFKGGIGPLFGYKLENAMNILGITRICCRSSVMGKQLFYERSVSTTYRTGGANIEMRQKPTQPQIKVKPTIKDQPRPADVDDLVDELEDLDLGIKSKSVKYVGI